jgi:hypothetical protein
MLALSLKAISRRLRRSSEHFALGQPSRTLAITCRGKRPFGPYSTQMLKCGRQTYKSRRLIQVHQRAFPGQ